MSANGGLVPRQYQSGECDRKGRITRRGPALLRKLLVECAWVMLRYNGWARAWQKADGSATTSAYRGWSNGRQTGEQRRALLHLCR